jgi:hypothetical protein
MKAPCHSGTWLKRSDLAETANFFRRSLGFRQGGWVFEMDSLARTLD